MSGIARWSCLLTDVSPIREWDDQFLVFNPLTASTHLISPSAQEVLQTLREASAPLSLPELGGLLAGSAQVDGAFLTELGTCLQEFEDLGLAESFKA